MKQPLRVTFKGIPHSDAIEARIEEHARKLERFYDRIVHCDVVVEAPKQRGRHGHLYQIRMDVTVPGGHVVVSHQGPKDQAHEDVYVALRDAFKAARRQLQDHARKQRGDVKRHQPPDYGVVTKLFPYEGYGFLETPGALEIYFHRNAVLADGFDQLDEGMKVRFVLAEGEGEHGPQASTVEVVS